MNFFKKAIEVLFVCGIVLFMLIGTVIVLVQGYSILVSNGALAISVKATLSRTAFIIATVTGILGFLQGYVNGWDMGD